MTGFSIGNFIGFKGNINAPKANGTTMPSTGATLPPALKEDTFVKSAQEEAKIQENTSPEDDYDDYDKEYELERKAWLQENIDILNQAAANLQNLSLRELYNALDTRFKLEYEIPSDTEPSYKSISDAIITKLDEKSIDTKEAAEILYLALSCIDSEPEATEDISKVISHISTLLHKEGESRYRIHFDTLKEAFKDTGAEFSGRVKTINSIEGKMPLAIAGNIKKGETNIFNAASDICGYRLVTDGSAEQSEKIVAQIEKLIEDGTYTPFLISSHGEEPYIPRDEILRLHDEKVFGYSIRPFPGFVGTNIILKDKDGKKLEIQIIGSKVNKVNVKEHKLYKLWTISPEEKVKYFKSRHMLDEYGSYASDCYSYARGLELGAIEPGTEKPKLPEGICEELRLI